MTEKIIGYCDQLGYLRCLDCISIAPKTKKDFKVYQNNAAFINEYCDICGEKLRK